MALTLRSAILRFARTGALALGLAASLPSFAANHTTDAEIQRVLQSLPALPEPTGAPCGSSETAEQVRELQQQIDNYPGGYPFDIEGRILLGDAHAPVLLAEFGDFACPYCKDLHETLMSILPQRPHSTRYVYKHLPVFGISSARAAKYMEGVSVRHPSRALDFLRSMHSEYATVWRLSDVKNENAARTSELDDIVRNLGLDPEELAGSFKTAAARVEADQAEAKQLGIGVHKELNLVGIRAIAALPQSRARDTG